MRLTPEINTFIEYTIVFFSAKDFVILYSLKRV